MTYTLGQITYDVASQLGICKRGTATGGSTTTIADSVERTEADDFWNKGTAWILRNASSPGIAPEGEVSPVSDFANSGGVITLRTAFSQAVASGDTYAVAYKYVPLEIIIEKVNQALIDYGPILAVDTTSITTASDKTEYTLPVAAKLNLRQVFLQTDNTDSDDNQWMEVFNWYTKPSAAGSTETLVVAEQYSSGYALKIVYDAMHAELLQSTDQLSEHIPLERILYPAIRDCFQYRKDNTGWSDWDEQIGRWTERTEMLRQRNPERYPTAPGRLVYARQDTPSLRNYPGDRQPR